MMTTNLSYQKVLNYAIRKLSVGIGSVIIGATFLGATPILADQHQAKVTYGYVLESELSSDELSLIQKGTPRDNIAEETTIYLVYSPDKRTTLPKTNDKSLFTYSFLGGLSLLVVGVTVKRNKKLGKGRLPYLLMVTSVFFVPTGMTVSSIEVGALSHYHQELQAGQVFETADIVLNIPNHYYIGFIEVKNDVSKSVINQEISNISLKEEKKAEISHPSSAPIVEDRAINFEVPSDAPTVVLEEAQIIETHPSTAPIVEDRTINFEVPSDAPTTSLEASQIIETHPSTAPIVEDRAINFEVPSEAPTVSLEEAQIIETHPSTAPIVEDTAISFEVPLEAPTVSLEEAQIIESHPSTAPIVEDTAISFEVPSDVPTVSLEEAQIIEAHPSTAPIVEDTAINFEVPSDAPKVVLEEARTVTETSQETLVFETHYIADDSLEYGQVQPQSQGVTGSIVTTITYLVEDGNRGIELSQESQTTAPINALIKIGTKPFEETEIITDNGVRYQVTYQTTYQVNEKTGEVTSQRQEIARKQLENLKKEKPMVTVSQIVTNDDEQSLVITYDKEDPDTSFKKLKVSVKEGSQVIKQVESQLENRTLQLDGLKPYTTYQIETTVVYNTGTGDVEEILEPKQEVEFIPKKIEFRSIKKAELFQLDDNHRLKRVTGLEEAPADASSYLVKLTTDYDSALLPVAKFTEVDGYIEGLIDHPRLVSFASDNISVTDGFRIKVDKITTGNGIYTDFNQLINDMTQNPSGHFKLGSDLYATPTEGPAYILSNFSGNLSSVAGKHYTIYHLNKPLFNRLEGARVENISLKEVNITSQADTASLALWANNASINRVFVDGKLTYDPNNSNTHQIGGLVATLAGSTVDSSYVNLSITARDRANNNVAGLVARANSYFATSHLTNNVVAGEIKTGNQSKKAALLAFNFGSTQIDNNISSMFIDMLGSGITGLNNKRVGDGQNGSITQEQFNDRLKALGVLTKKQAQQLSDYKDSELSHYQSDREIAYYNTKKLLPLYDRHTIIKYGNLIETTSALYHKRIVSVTPMANRQFVTNLKAQENINQLFVLYEDDSKEILSLTGLGEFSDTKVIEFRLLNKLLYTPDYFMSTKSQLRDQIMTTLSSVSLADLSVKTALKVTQKQDIRALYLDDSFAQIKNQLTRVVENLLSSSLMKTDNLATQQYLLRKIEDNKEKLLLGLSYLNRLYGIQFGDYYIKELVMYRPSFYGKAIETLDWLIDIGSQGYNNLLLYKNEAFYANTMKVIDKPSLLAFLDHNRMIFAPEMSANDWFKSATKAYIHEEASRVLPEKSVAIYERLQTKESYRSYILPLLTLKEDNVYAVTTLSSLILGGYGREIDMNIKETDKTRYQKELERVHQLIGDQARRWQDFVDLFMKMVSPSSQRVYADKLTELFAGYYIKDSVNGKIAPLFNEKRRWAEPHGDIDTSIDDFFGPIGRYYPQSANKDSAYANKSLNRIYFDSVDILGHEGGTTYSHEMTHAYDEDGLLNGYGYRDGQEAEAYALGLFESVTSSNSYYYGFNFMYDLNQGAHNNHISRFQTKNDFKDYLSGVFDVTYLLDGTEADIILKKDKADQKFFFNKIELVKDPNTNDGVTHGKDVIREITTKEWEQMTLTSVSDLIRQKLVSQSSTLLKQDYLRDNHNNYYFIPLYYPIYAAYENDSGTSGGLMFRRTAFELLATFGWDEGFIPYVSNQLKQEAQVQQQPLSDSFIFKKIFNGQYENYEDFRIKMFAKRMAKKDNIKPITIMVDNQSYTITSFEILEELMTKAIDEDLAKLKLGQHSFAREKLKAAIMKAYNASTDNFRMSIFND
ncbi:YSIRK signal domain/LPXTG anchor domain surface protein [Streptococcus marimammalium]|uniref:YSIRK signal domain/LPXTG anchor domain surface protein n=1 Tax=Streptococcus marimammalium TaxID=269666 RepID=UPI0003680BA7|nr:YSIRK signal domain/LPXTG anchor domain surface protein [Streptococcus marimammalium]